MGLVSLLGRVITIWFFIVAAMVAYGQVPVALSQNDIFLRSIGRNDDTVP
jgi:hypothetical protein